MAKQNEDTGIIRLLSYSQVLLLNNKFYPEVDYCNQHCR